MRCFSNNLTQRSQRSQRNAEEERSIFNFIIPSTFSASPRPPRGKIPVNFLPITYYLLLFTFYLFFVSCQDPFTPFSLLDQKIPANMGSFSLQIEGLKTRAIVPGPDQNFEMFELVFTGASSFSVNLSKANVSNPVILQPGFYNLSVTAFADAAKTKPAARGTLTNIQIIEGVNTALPVTLYPFDILLGQQPGSFSWAITIEPTVTRADMAIIRLSDNLTVETVSLLNTSASIMNNLDTGFYRIIFTLEKTGRQPVIWRQFMHIYQNLETFFEYTFTDAHFNNISYAVTFDSNGGTPNNLTADYLHGQTVTEPADPAKINSFFMGWYLQNGTVGGCIFRTGKCEFIRAGYCTGRAEHSGEYIFAQIRLQTVHLIII